jgi:hypothetical protein
MFWCRVKRIRARVKNEGHFPAKRGWRNTII